MWFKPGYASGAIDRRRTTHIDLSRSCHSGRAHELTVTTSTAAEDKQTDTATMKRFKISKTTVNVIKGLQQAAD